MNSKLISYQAVFIKKIGSMGILSQLFSAWIDLIFNFVWSLRLSVNPTQSLSGSSLDAIRGKISMDNSGGKRGIMTFEFERENSKSEQVDESCELAMSRKDFVAKVLRRATIAGAILAAPAVIDKFLVPPGIAAMMSDSGTGGETGMSGMEP